ncbi:MAG: MEKHLA domain-containing protein [Methylococcales bacterium]|nr:MEKHLA domain-containing protein [Methylococcales bacterium]
MSGQNERFWVRPEIQQLAGYLADSYEQVLHCPLLSHMTPRLGIGFALYYAPFAVLAHSAEIEPKFIYANLVAQHLFERSETQLLGLPSRQSAEPGLREARAAMLAQAHNQGFIRDYTGVRIAKSGQRFRIEQAIIWNVVDSQGVQIGQAARFADWTML